MDFFWLRVSIMKFSSFGTIKPEALTQSSFKSLIVKAATVVAPKYTSIKPLGYRVLVKIKEIKEKTKVTFVHGQVPQNRLTWPTLLQHPVVKETFNEMESRVQQNRLTWPTLLEHPVVKENSMRWRRGRCELQLLQPDNLNLHSGVKKTKSRHQMVKKITMLLQTLVMF